MASSLAKEQLAQLSSTEDLVELCGVAALVKGVGSDMDKGLTSAQAAVNSKAYGANRFPEKTPRSFFEHLMDAFEDFTLKVLIGAAVVSIIIGVHQQNTADTVQGVAILLAVAIVSTVNSFQNWSKDKEFRSLAQIKADRNVRVIRDGKEQDVSVFDVVVGDVLVVASGDALPCDGVLLRGYGVEVNQSSMNGESENASKVPAAEALSAPKSVSGHLPDCILIGSTQVAEGEGHMLATAVGTASKMGQSIEILAGDEEEKTPLQQRLEVVADKVGLVGFGCGILTTLVLLVLWLMQPVAEGTSRDWSQVLHFALVGVSIVVVAVPEGLPLAVTISLAFSMRRMMKDNNLVRELQACETMGSATVIASDKTGTLTENRMSVVKAWAFGRSVGDISQLENAINNPGAVHRLSKAIALNSTADLDMQGARIEYIRSPSEGALLKMLYEHLHLLYTEDRERSPYFLARRPFNKETKYMSTITFPETASAAFAGSGALSPIASSAGRKSAPASPGASPFGDDVPMLYTKGAPEFVLEMCTSTQGPDGHPQPITAEVLFNLREQVLSMAREGLRCLAVAYKRMPYDAELVGVTPGAQGGAAGAKLHAVTTKYSEALKKGELETGLTLLGLFGLQDPLREGVVDAIKSCQSAGIRVLMVTGDHRETATQIARQAGILTAQCTLGTAVMEGSQFRKLNEAERITAAKHLAVLARSSPLDKHMLVKALKDMGEIVAVTGDGTNDAPALKTADVGLSMGIAGTEVAKEASDIVILDDRFSSIVASVRWGRSIKENIRKFLTFQLTINMVALTLTFITACTKNGSTEALPITPVQLLWVNLIMDSFAALALATEPPSDDLLKHPSKGKSEQLITRTMIKNMCGHALFQTVLLLWLTMKESGASFFGLDGATALGTVYHNTIVFTTFVALQVFNLFNCRSVHDEWNVLRGFGGSFIGQFIVAVIVSMQVLMVQFGGTWTQTHPLSLHQWSLCILLGSSSIFVGAVLRAVPELFSFVRSIFSAPSVPKSAKSRGPLYADTSSVRSTVQRTITEEVAEAGQDEHAGASAAHPKTLHHANSLDSLVAGSPTASTLRLRGEKSGEISKSLLKAASAAGGMVAEGSGDDTSTGGRSRANSARRSGKGKRV